MAQRRGGQILLSLVMLGVPAGYVAHRQRMRRVMEHRRARSLNRLIHEMESTCDRAMQIAHDKKQEHLYLYHCILQGETEEAMAFLGRQQQLAGSLDVWTGIGCVDFLLSRCYDQMQRHHIQFHVCSGVLNLPMEKGDFCLVLGNLLDNAVKAAAACREGERRILLCMTQRGEMFRLQIENTSVQIPCIRGGRIRPLGKAPGHGYGLRSVEEMVHRYGGELAIDYTERMFRVRVMFWQRLRGERERAYGV